jgi:predicted ATPase
MSDPRNILQSKFEKKHRHANFGNVLEEIHVDGFRCHKRTKIEIQSPITALTGLNGTGKSTILHIAAVAYKKSTGKSYYLRDFFVLSSLDPAPYTPTSRVMFKYCDNVSRSAHVTLSRSAKSTGWSGYKRRRDRDIFFAGAAMYLPKVEKRDFTFYRAAALTIQEKKSVAEKTSEWISRIIGRFYDGMNTISAQSGNRSGKVLSFSRDGVEYSEAHMGYGEGRIAYLVENLELLPEKSLVLIEEPETSLHPSAQHQLGHYLMDVSIRRGHQIILTTHCEYLLRALPGASRVYFHWTGGNLTQVRGLTASQATSLMTGGHDSALVVLVEDCCAKAILSELLRKADNQLLRSIQIHEGGSCTEIKTTMACLAHSQMNIACVLDGDQSPVPKQNVFTLPGKMPPEKEIFDTQEVQAHLQDMYGLNWSDFYAHNGLASKNHHDWFSVLADTISVNEKALIWDLAKVYVKHVDGSNLTALLRESISQ